MNVIVAEPKIMQREKYIRIHKTKSIKEQTMTLEKQDAELFYQLWFPLLDYVNKKYKICPKIKEINRSQGIVSSDAKAISNYVWSHTEVLKEYLSEAQLPEEQAQIVAGWERCKPGKYIMERHLKKGTVFISEEDQRVYMVKGLFSTWEEMMGKGPLLLDTVLIPFRDSIISDGLVISYPVYFGRGCSEAFKEIYRKAKEEHSICSSFGDDESERAPRKKKGSGKVESYVIKVALNGQCYRHIQISKYAPLGVLSEVILETFGFDDDHCHAFFMDNRYWSNGDAYYSDDMDGGSRISYRMPLHRLGLKKGDAFKYLFDFGDEWRFQCRILQELEEKTDEPKVIKAVGEAPEQYPSWDDEEL